MCYNGALLISEGVGMANYELVFIVSPEVADDEMTNAVSKVSDLIGRIGGVVNEVNQWGRKKLTYPVRRFTEGNYVLAKVELKPASIKELDANLRMSGDILRISFSAVVSGRSTMR